MELTESLQTLKKNAKNAHSRGPNLDVWKPNWQTECLFILFSMRNIWTRNNETYNLCAYDYCNSFIFFLVCCAPFWFCLCRYLCSFPHIFLFINTFDMCSMVESCIKYIESSMIRIRIGFEWFRWLLFYRFVRFSVFIWIL